VPTDAELATALQISLKEWQWVKLARLAPLSLQQPVGEGERLLQDLLSDSVISQGQDDRVWLRQVLLQIETPTRKVLEFVFLHDLTQKETAMQLGISVVTVARRLKKGLQLLRNLLAEQ
jgi:RNA polymerase sigma-B factor